jgi:hypothetical protein
MPISQSIVIIATINLRYLLESQKFGSKLPKSVDLALASNIATNTTYWKDKIAPEFKNVDVAI